MFGATTTFLRSSCRHVVFVRGRERYVHLYDGTYIMFFNECKFERVLQIVWN